MNGCYSPRRGEGGVGITVGIHMDQVRRGKGMGKEETTAQILTLRDSSGVLIT